MPTLEADEPEWKTSSGFERFQRAMVEAAQAEWMPTFQSDKEELSKVVKNHLYGLDGATALRPKDQTEREKYFQVVFDGFTEISTSLDALNDMAFYIRRFPGSRVAKDRYLMFVVEMHLSELYILQERTSKYLTDVYRQFRKDDRHQLVKETCDRIREFVKKALANSLAVRHAHIHKARFDHPDFARLRTLRLLSRAGPDKHLWSAYYEAIYVTVRKEWKQILEKNNRAVKDMLDAFFDALSLILLSRDTNALMFPSTDI